MKKKANILHLITGLGIGGAEKVVLDLVNNTEQSQFNLFVLSLADRVEMVSIFEEHNVNVDSLKQSKSILSLAKMIYSVHRYVQSNNIHLIHAHMFHSAMVTTIIKIIHPHIKIVFTPHNVFIGGRHREVMLFLMRCFRDVDILFSKDVKQFYHKSDYAVIPNGISMNDYKVHTKEYEKFTFIAIGRLEKVKNFKVLIDIAKSLISQYVFQIMIVGEGNLRSELLEQIEKNNLSDTIHLLGYRKDIPILLNKAHCLLVPSLWEGLPIVILEAGASRTPIISTAVGSIPSLLNNFNATVVNIEDFEGAMAKMLKFPSVQRDKAKVLYDLIEQRYAIQNVVSQHIKIYNRLLIR